MLVRSDEHIEEVSSALRRPLHENFQASPQATVQLPAYLWLDAPFRFHRYILVFPYSLFNFYLANGSHIVVSLPSRYPYSLPTPFPLVVLLP